MIIFYVMGPTNVGKTTLMKAVTDNYPEFATVEVGRLLRAKYPPEYFDGQGAPAKTREEAWELMLNGLREAEARGAAATFVDGQPRDMVQAEAIRTVLPYRTIVLWAPPEVRRQRAVVRDGASLPDDVRAQILAPGFSVGQLADPSSLPGALLLSLRRLETDLVSGYDVLVKTMLDVSAPPLVWDTSHPQYDPVLYVAALRAAIATGIFQINGTQP